jgi:hypothetical protein
MRRLALAALLATLPLSAQAAPPAAGTPSLFATGLAGPEGICVARDGALVVGTSTGEIRRYQPDGSFTVLADVGESLAGLAATRDGSILAAAFGANRVWIVTPLGAASVLADGIPGANAIAVTRRGRIYVSASAAGTIVEITTGVPVTRAGGLGYPNGLAIGRDHQLYVAETSQARVSRLRILPDGTLGTPEVWGTGLPAADGVAFDRAGNLLVVGLDTLSVVPRTGGVAQPLSTDPLLFWPSSLAFGRGHGFSRRDVFAANFGLPLGSGTEILRIPYNRAGANPIR